MQRYLVVMLLCCLLGACKQNELKKDVSEVVKVNVPAFEEKMLSLRISDLKLESQDDTISYALGVAWANGISKIGLNKISYAFYTGVHDYMFQNKTFTNAKESGERLDKEIQYLKEDSFHKLDSNIVLRDIKLESKFDTLSYQLGYAWTRGAKEYGISRITPSLLKGLTNGLQSNVTIFDYPKADKYLRGYVERLKEKQYADVKFRNGQWLVENKVKNEVITLPSGLQYKVVKKGTGKLPKADQVVVCQYVAKLIDGTKFESTYDDGAPLRTTPAGVIPALREGLSKMKVGSAWELYVPYNLGYGSGGIKDKVPPFATLIYEIELIGLEDELR